MSTRESKASRDRYYVGGWGVKCCVVAADRPQGQCHLHPSVAGRVEQLGVTEVQCGRHRAILSN
jgi:hypothetical protein